jgi:hypothetical protein
MSKRQIKYKASKKVSYSDSDSSRTDEDNNSEGYNRGLSKKKSRQRQENSLGELTKNFINFIKDQGEKEVNINEIVKKLKVKKRRIYDITNVLEGNFISCCF